MSDYELSQVKQQFEDLHHQISAYPSECTVVEEASRLPSRKEVYVVDKKLLDDLLLKSLSLFEHICDLENGHADELEKLREEHREEVQTLVDAAIDCYIQEKDPRGVFPGT